MNLVKEALPVVPVLVLTAVAVLVMGVLVALSSWALL
jgi:hypothetical protein